MGERERGDNMLDGGAPYYDTYETKDGKYMAVGALESQFFTELMKGLGLSGTKLEENRLDRSTWPKLKETFTGIFKEKTRSEWEQVFDGTDACCTPVLEYRELEKDSNREGDQRPAVTLRDTPAFAVAKGPGSRDPATGQGEGVKGESYTGTALRPGEGGEATLQEWLGWKQGKDFEIKNGGLVNKSGSKL